MRRLCSQNCGQTQRPRGLRPAAAQLMRKDRTPARSAGAAAASIAEEMSRNCAGRGRLRSHDFCVLPRGGWGRLGLRVSASLGPEAILSGVGSFLGRPCSVDGSLGASFGSGDALQGFIRAFASVRSAACHGLGPVGECLDAAIKRRCRLDRQDFLVGLALLTKLCFKVPGTGVSVSLLRSPVAIFGRSVTFAGGLVAILCRLLAFPRRCAGWHGPISKGGIVIELRGLLVATRGLIVATSRLLVEPCGLMVAVVSARHGISQIGQQPTKLGHLQAIRPGDKVQSDVRDTRIGLGIRVRPPPAGLGRSRRRPGRSVASGRSRVVWGRRTHQRAHVAGVRRRSVCRRGVWKPQVSYPSPPARSWSAHELGPAATGLG